jgi:hypothetical protein
VAVKLTPRCKTLIHLITIDTTTFVTVAQLRTNICEPLNIPRSTYYKTLSTLRSTEASCGLMDQLRDAGVIPPKTSCCKLITLHVACKRGVVENEVATARHVLRGTKRMRGDGGASTSGGGLRRSNRLGGS